MSGSVGSFFEGSEKKLELAVDPSLASLRSFGDPYWTDVVRGTGADILSRLSNDHCDAYLLSESSLFVFDHHMAMMTCGRTTLHEAALALLERIPAERVQTLVYKRKHEEFPHDQPTSFFDDVRALARRLPGRAFQFGNRDEHHLYLFEVDRQPAVRPLRTTAEVLMHGLAEGVRGDFCIGNRSTPRQVRAATGVDRILPGFEVDDHLFRPNGYSLNAVRDEEYYAVHVTPEWNCSYASFETNHVFADDLEPVLARLLGVFRPRTWDVILYDGRAAARIGVPGYRLRSHVAHDGAPGRTVRFRSYFRPQRAVARPIELSLS
jgi:S-adenosylmethionine decarboxylase